MGNLFPIGNRTSAADRENMIRRSLEMPSPAELSVWATMPILAFPVVRSETMRVVSAGGDTYTGASNPR